MSRSCMRSLTVVEGRMVGKGLSRGVGRNGFSKTSMGVQWGGNGVGPFASSLWIITSSLGVSLAPFLN